MKEDTDIILVRQCLKGNNRAFESIVDKYEKPVFNAALRIINNYQDAEDVTQSSFVKAFEKLPTFKPKYKFFSWLYRIVVNESLNFVSQRKRLQELNTDLVSREKTAEEAYDDIETSQQVQVAVMDLKVEHRVVIVLKHFQDLSYTEISQILDIPEKTMKSRLFTAREQLKTRLLRRYGKND